MGDFHRDNSVAVWEPPELKSGKGVALVEEDAYRPTVQFYIERDDYVVIYPPNHSGLSY